MYGATLSAVGSTFAAMSSMAVFPQMEMSSISEGQIPASDASVPVISASTSSRSFAMVFSLPSMHASMRLATAAPKTSWGLARRTVLVRLSALLVVQAADDGGRAHVDGKAVAPPLPVGAPDGGESASRLADIARADARDLHAIGHGSLARESVEQPPAVLDEDVAVATFATPIAGAARVDATRQERLAYGAALWNAYRLSVSRFSNDKIHGVIVSLPLA